MKRVGAYLVTGLAGLACSQQPSSGGSASSSATEGSAAGIPSLPLPGDGGLARPVDPLSVPGTGSLSLVACSFSALRAKAARSIGFECEWNSAGDRFWGRKEPTAQLRVSMVAGARVAAVARDAGATEWTPVHGEESTYHFRFASTEDAIAAIRPLLCDPAVETAHMSLLVPKNDDEEMYAWCEDQQPNKRVAPDGPSSVGPIGPPSSGRR